MTRLPDTAPSPPAPLGENLIEQWLLDPAVSYLNHGSYGARPRVVAEAQQRLRDRMEAQPIAFLEADRDTALDVARAAAGRLLDMSTDDFGFVTNATEGVNAVLRSFPLEAGDELVTTDHAYPAIARTMEYFAARAGATVRTARLELPLHGPDDILDAIEAELGPRTRLVVVDHISSPTAIVFPVHAIAQRCAERGIELLVDGAHAPGMLELDVPSVGAMAYVGNFHKWVCAPLGAGFAWVRPDHQDEVHPPTISYYFGEGFAREFTWQGTRDITPWLAVPDAMAFFDALGWERMRTHNHGLAVWAHDLLLRAWDVEPITPRDGSMLGAMATVPLPAAAKQHWAQSMDLHTALLERYGVEAPVVDWLDRWWIRVSCQVYNTPDDYRRLAAAVQELLT